MLSFFKVTKEYKIGYELEKTYVQLQLAGSGTRVRLSKGQGVAADRIFNLNVLPSKKYLAPIRLKALKTQRPSKPCS